MRKFTLLALTVIIVLIIGAFAPGAPATAAKQVAGDVRDFRAETPHPVHHGWTDTYTFPGAQFVRLHFQAFDLAEGDKLIVTDAAGGQMQEYTGRGFNGNGDFWSFAVEGDTVKVEMQSVSGKSHGFKINDIGYGTVALSDFVTPEIVVGTDGREDVACHAGDAVANTAQAPVARLLFTVKRTQYLCTGELIRGSNANTLITNNHCISSQTVVSTLEARFNYQYTTCNGTTLATAQSFAGGTFLKTNAEKYSSRKASTTGLDYTLLTLQGTPEATFGELVAVSTATTVGTQMNFIQHPAGRPKEIGWWEDAEHTVRCKIDTINMTYGSSYPNSQAGYGCDSEGGSSGSAITRASDGKVIALHHYGGVTSILNSGTMMSFICSNAGALLTCDAN